MPWPIVSGLLARLSMIEFRRHAHTAQLLRMVATLGGAKNPEMWAYLLNFAQVSGMGKGQAWEAKFLESAAAELDLRLAMRCGYVSQFVFDALST